jgi:hypothetical protein
LFTSRSIFSCKLTNFVALGICGLHLIPTIILTSADVNEASVIIIIDWGIALEEKG